MFVLRYLIDNHQARGLVHGAHSRLKSYWQFFKMAAQPVLGVRHGYRLPRQIHEKS